MTRLLRHLLSAASFLAGGLAALAVVLALPLLGAAAAAALTSSPGTLQLGAVIVAALALRPEPAPPSAYAVVIDLTADELLAHLLVNVEVGV